MTMEFKYPAVSEAYQSSGKTTALAIVLMTFCGVLVSLIGGVAFGAVMEPISGIASKGTWYLWLLELAIKAVIALGLGWAIGGTIGWAGQKGKNRNDTVGAGIGLLCGISALALIGIVSEGRGIGILSGLALIGAVGLLPALIGAVSSDTPFCETHDQFMEHLQVATMPQSSEQTAMQALDEGRFNQLAHLHRDDSGSSYCTIELHSCSTCREGYLAVNTTLAETTTNSDGTTDTETQTQLVYSAKLAAEQVGEILDSDNGEQDTAPTGIEAGVVATN